MASAPKLSLGWEKFDQSIRDNLSRLRESNDFSDVTLVTRDQEGPSFPAHRLVLAACSPVFRRILNVDPHHHPLLYISCVTSDSLRLLLTFIYEGRVEVSQDHLNDFLTAAEELKIEGLSTSVSGNKSEDMQSFEQQNESKNKSQDIQSLEKQIVKEEELLGEIENEVCGEQHILKVGEQLGEMTNEVCASTLIPSQEYVTSDADSKICKKRKDVVKKKPFESKIDVPEHVAKVYCYEKITIKDLKDIKTTVDAMTERVGKVWRCKFCGKTTPGSQRNTLGLHIESHFEGLSYKCSHCDKSCKNKGALRGHMHRHHQAVPDPNLQPTLVSFQNLQTLQ